MSHAGFTELAADEKDPLASLHKKMAENSLAGHWQPRVKRPEMLPYVWKWDAIYACVIEAGNVVKLGAAGDAANRRTVQLSNPGMPGHNSTSRTLQMSVQLVKPGETAECHRHSAAALRFIVEGDGSAFTNVDGEPMQMEPGDLVLTPNWAWHDHHNPGTKPVIWLDVLDIHLANYLEAAYIETYDGASTGAENYLVGATQPAVRPMGYSRERYGVVRRPVNANGMALPYVYKWSETLRILQSMAATEERDPYEGIKLDFTQPVTGGPTMPTINCAVQLLAPGETTRFFSQTGSTVYFVMQGKGVSNVGPQRDDLQPMAWDKRDCFFIPPKYWRSFTNTASEPAILFSVSDKPVLEKLGLYREFRE